MNGEETEYMVGRKLSEIQVIEEEDDDEDDTMEDDD